MLGAVLIWSPLLIVVGAPVSAFVLLRLGEVVGVKNSTRRWVILSYVLMLVEATGLSVMLGALLP